jgi:hypothetical protein
MQKHTLDQSPVRPPLARSNAREDMIAAANDRAAFWKYAPEGPWTVYVTIGKKDVPVHKSEHGEYTIGKID